MYTYTKSSFSAPKKSEYRCPVKYSHFDNIFAELGLILSVVFTQEYAFREVLEAISTELPDGGKQHNGSLR